MTPEHRHDFDQRWRTSLQPPAGGEAKLRRALVQRTRTPRPRYALASLASLVAVALVAVQFTVRDRPSSGQSQPASTVVVPVQYRVAVSNDAVSVYVLHTRSITSEAAAAD